MTKDEYQLVGNNYDHKSDIPKEHDIYYRCLFCESIIASLPDGFVRCKCRNVVIDIDYFRMRVGDFKNFEVLRKITKEK